MKLTGKRHAITPSLKNIGFSPVLYARNLIPKGMWGNPSSPKSHFSDLFIECERVGSIVDWSLYYRPERTWQ